VASDVQIAPHPEVATMLVVTWNQRAAADEAWLSWSFEGVERASPARPRPAGAADEVVLGVPPESVVALTLHATVDGEQIDQELGEGTTGSLPVDLVVPTLMIADPAGMRPEPYLLTSVDVGPYNFFGPVYVVILDEEARVVWYRAVSGKRLTLFPRVSELGSYLTWEATTYYTPSGVSTLTRATLDLDEEVIVVPDLGLTYFELADGSFLYDENGGDGEYHLSWFHVDQTSERIWDCAPWMSSYSLESWACAPNTVLYNPDTDTVLWSMFDSSTVVEIALGTGEIVREMGEYPGGYAFVPPEAMFQLQHYPNWTPEGTLLVSTHVPSEENVQVAREFEIDDVTQTLHQVWSYTPAAGYYAEYAGEVVRIGNGNVLWQLGTAGIIQEATPGGDVVWEADWDGHMTGNVTPIADLYALASGR
jgi:hypothetical protein